MRKDNPAFVPDSPFARPMTQAHMDFFSAIPKTELHCHLLGTTQKATFEDLVKESGAPVSQEEIDGFFTRGDKPVGVLRIFRALEEHILIKPEMLTRITYEYLQDCKKHGIRYTEFFWNYTGLARHYSYEAAQTAIIEGIHKGEKDFGVIGRLIPSIDREAEPEFAVELVREMIAHRAPETIGLGIDYRENDHEPENFWKAFMMAKDAGFKITIHAGEFGCHWRNVETAMDLLKADRLDHCYTIIDNPALVQEAKNRNFIFTVVPTNSYYLRTFSDDEWAIKQPIRKMVEMGLRVHPNTDDPTMHHVNATQTWMLMYNFLNFSLDQLKTFMLNGIDGAWIDSETKEKWKVQWSQEFDELAKNFPN